MYKYLTTREKVVYFIVLLSALFWLLLTILFFVGATIAIWKSLIGGC